MLSANADRRANELKPARPVESGLGRAVANDLTVAMTQNTEVGNQAQSNESVTAHGMLRRCLHLHVFLLAAAIVVLVSKWLLNTRPARWIMDVAYPIIALVMSTVAALLMFLARKAAAQLPCQGDAVFACMRRCRSASARRARRRRRFARARRREQLSSVRAGLVRDAEMEEAGNSSKAGRQQQCLAWFVRMWREITCTEKRAEAKRAKILGMMTSNAAVIRREAHDERRLHRGAFPA